MLTILLRARAYIEKTGNIRAADVERIRAYGRRHPMWRLCAPDSVVTAHDAILRAWDAAVQREAA